MIRNLECIVCQKTQTKALYTVNNFVISKCQTCGYIFCQHPLKPINFSELYNHNYFHGDDYLNYVSDEEIIKKNFRRFLRIIKPFQSSGKLLEIGSAYGFFLDEARKHFECSGVEISKDASEYAIKEKGLNIHNVNLLNFEPERNNYDTIVMWDTIEHLESPDLFLVKIHKLLKDEGYLFLTTGNIGAFIPRIKKQNWRLIKPPWHLHYFSSKTITLLLQRLGFEVRLIKAIGFYRSLNMIILKLLENFPKGSRIAEKLLKIFNIQSASIYLNLFDIMFVVAQKKTNQSNE